MITNTAIVTSFNHSAPVSTGVAGTGAGRSIGPVGADSSTNIPRRGIHAPRAPNCPGGVSRFVEHMGDESRRDSGVEVFTSSHEVDKNHSCLAVASFFPWICTPSQEASEPLSVEMRPLVTVNQQPTREPPITIPQLPQVETCSNRPALLRDETLGHHPGGEADEYYYGLFRGEPPAKDHPSRDFPLPSRRQVDNHLPAVAEESREDSDDTDIPMAQPALGRMVLSDCFSVGSLESDDEVEADDDSTDDFPEVGPPERRPSLFSLGSSHGSAQSFITDEEIRDEQVPASQPGPERFTVLVGATTCKSFTAELCDSSDDDQGDEPHTWRSGRPNPRLNIPIPLLERGNESYRPLTQVSRCDDVPNLVPLPLSTTQDDDYDDTSSETINLHSDNSCVQNPEWVQEPQEFCALLISPEGEGCLWRFVHLWHDPEAEPVDQSLFAGFDEDFSTQKFSPEPARSESMTWSITDHAFTEMPRQSKGEQLSMRSRSARAAFKVSLMRPVWTF